MPGTVAPPPPVRVDHEAEDGDVLDFAGGAVVLHVPGHTPGGIALHLPRAGVLRLRIGHRSSPYEEWIGPSGSPAQISAAGLAVKRRGSREAPGRCGGAVTQPA
jgi:glyoxylase-like metal-dependent hydrolase (beta-lactamase superfamily II)